MTTHELADQATKYIDAAGTFLCKVKEPGNGWIDKSKTGTPFVRIPCIVDDPESPQFGREIVWRGYLTDAAVKKTVERLERAFGTDWSWPSLVQGRTTFAGLRCRIAVEEEEWQGEVRYKAKWLNPEIDDRPAKRLPQEELDDIVSRLDALPKEESW
jgi:hypothetical protein